MLRLALYQPDQAGNVGAIRENGATSGAGVLGAYAYDDRGRRTSLTRGNGTATSYTFDNASRLTELVQNLNGTGSDLTLGFAYNPASGITTNTRSNDAFAYTGHANQNVTNSHNGLNQVTATGSTSVSHDARGNITAIGSSSYGYSSENLLTSAPGSVTLAYDPMLRLYETVGSGTTTRFGYDGTTMIAEYNGSNALQRRYVHGPGVDEPLAWYEGTGTTTRRWLHADERGSVVAVSDGSGDLVGTRNRYDEYGAPQGTLTGRFGYTGQAWLPEVGLWHYKARMYNPTLGRFMQTDPIGYGSGMNLYAYVRGDPVNFVDPSGLREDCAVQPCDGPIEVTGPRRGFGAFSGGGGGNIVPPRNAEDRGEPSICPGVTQNGNEIGIGGTIDFRRGDYSASAPERTIPLLGEVPLEDQLSYINMINTFWTRPIGPYSVTTRMTIGTGMLSAFVGNPGGGGGRAEIGGRIMWLRPLQPLSGNSVYRAGDARIVAHEFGHILGSDHPLNGVDGGIMNRGASGEPLPSQIALLLDFCNRGPGGN